MKKTILIVGHGYYGQGENWDGVVHHLIDTVMQEAEFYPPEYFDVKLVFGTGELERGGDLPLSIQQYRTKLQNTSELGIIHEDITQYRHGGYVADARLARLDEAVVLTDTMSTGAEAQAVLAIADKVGAQRIMSVFRPEHWRAGQTVELAAKAHEAKVRRGIVATARPTRFDFEGVTPAVIMEGVHMDDPKRDIWAVFLDKALRKKTLSFVFGFKLDELKQIDDRQKLVDFLTELNELLKKFDLPQLDLTLDPKHQ